MENKRKDYKKPTVEKVDVQWSKCIAAGSGSRANVSIKIDPAAENNTQIWFGSSNSSWNNGGF